ncbi:MAG: type II toxin-antitoxin system VapC family toxin [Actinomycetia bacterium]|nr:type II toxin-antitoxin system VapC family toxin [Actinomycetes bacterium]
MKTAIDTNVLLDLLTADPTFADASERALRAVLRDGPAIICPVVAAELAAAFEDPAAADQFLKDLNITVEAMAIAAWHDAGRAWRQAVRRRGPGLQCPRCGTPVLCQCVQCGEPIRVRQHVVSDFLIGAHALHQADQLLTRDRGYYRTYFPDLRVLDPAQLK